MMITAAFGVIGAGRHRTAKIAAGVASEIGRGIVVYILAAA